MKILISQQQNKKLLIEFHHGKFVNKYLIGKSDDFLPAVDRFFKISDNPRNDISDAELDFANVGMLTERIVRAIIIGLRF